jgi:hypothetical protein
VKILLSINEPTPIPTPDGVIALALTPENHEELAGALSALLSSLRMYQSLPPAQQTAVYDLARGYAAAGQISPLRKLFQNTLIYLAEHRYEPTSAGMFAVKGLTRIHTVFVNDGVWSCDCDLANGRGKYVGHAGECSHIQTIKLSQVPEAA